MWSDDLAAFDKGGEVHVWLLRADRPEETSLLSRGERLAAARFRMRADRRRYVAARTALRLLTARYTGADAATLVFTGGSGRKPAVAGGGAEFNVSHSGDWVALAFARSMAVGIDVEELRALAELRDMVRQFFSPRERALIESIPPAARLPEFFRIWTRKEAVLKAAGRGLSVPLDEHDVLDPQPGGWTVVDLPSPPRYRAALATRERAELRVLEEAGS